MISSRILLVIESSTAAGPIPERLRALGHRISLVESALLDLKANKRFDAVILNIPAGNLGLTSRRAREHFNAPLLWWCDENRLGTSTVSAKVDGVLSSGMTDAELEWALWVGTRNYQNQAHLEREYRFLSLQFEEFKTIDKAKVTLSRSNNISEIHAYNIMRSKAMKERKKIAEIAAEVLKHTP